MALLGISARLVDGTRGRVGEEGWKGRVVEKIAFQVRILSSSPFLRHLSRCTRPTLHQELSFDVFGYVFFLFFPKSPLLNYMVWREEEAVLRFYRRSWKRGNYTRPGCAAIALRDNGKGRNGLFPWNSLDFVYN